MKQHPFYPALIALIIFLSGFQHLLAQNVAISSAANPVPDASAMLDISGPTKGLLIPRVALTSLTANASPITNPAESLLIYNTNAGLSGGAGYYYNTSNTPSAPTWIKLSTADLLAVTAIGATSNANGASVSGSNLTLQPANATNGGVVTAGTQTFGGMKTFKDDMTPAGRLKVPMGEINFFNPIFSGASATTINIPSSGISNGTTFMYILNPATSLSPDATDFTQTTNGRLKYTGTVARMFHIACTISMSSANSGGEIFAFGVYKSTAAAPTVFTSLDKSRVMQRFSSTSDVQSTALHVAVMLNPGDDISLWAGNMTTNGGDIVIHAITLFALGM